MTRLHPVSPSFIDWEWGPLVSYSIHGSVGLSLIHWPWMGSRRVLLDPWGSDYRVLWGGKAAIRYTLDTGSRFVSESNTKSPWWLTKYATQRNQVIFIPYCTTIFLLVCWDPAISIFWKTRNRPLYKASRAFRHSAPVVWNSLSANTRCANSPVSFKQLLKTELFAAANLFFYASESSSQMKVCTLNQQFDLTLPV